MGEQLQILVQLTITGLAFGSIYAILAVSFALVLSCVGVWNFASAGVYAVVAYIVWQLLELGLPLVMAALAAFVSGAALMVLCDLLVHEPLRRRGATTEIVMIGSLTVSILATAILGFAFGSEGHGYPGALLESTLSLGSVILTSWNIVAVVTGVVTLAVIGGILFRTSFGRLIRAYGDNAGLTEMMGESRTIPHFGAYVLASLAIVPAAILTAIQRGVDPGMGLQALLLAAVAAILGGVGNVWAAASGGLLLGLATNIPLLWLSGSWQSPIAFAILLVVLLARPSGIFGRPIAT